VNHPRTSWSSSVVAARLAFLTLTFVTACNDSTTSPDVPDPTGPVPSRAYRAEADWPTIAPGDSTRLRVRVDAETASVRPPAVHWASLNGGRLENVGSSDGVITWFSADTAGSYRLVARLRDADIADTLLVTVASPAVTATIAELVFHPETALPEPGDTLRFAVWGLTGDGDSVPAPVRLSVDQGSVRGLAFVSQDEGVFRIRATIPGSPVVGDTTVTIGNAVTRIELTPARDTIVVGDTVAFEVAGVERSGDRSQVSAGLSVNGAALPKPAFTSSEAGTFRIVASWDGGLLTDTAMIVVRADPPPPAEHAAPPPAVSSTSPELPRTRLDTRFVTPTGRQLAVLAGGDLQAAIDSAQRGDVILLAAGATFTGNFVLPAKPGSGWVTIMSAGTLPPEGTRATPATATSYARLRSPNASPAVSTQSSPSASYYRLVGLDIASTATTAFSLVYLGDGTGKATSVDQLPSHIYLDRVWIHGAVNQPVQRCLALNSRSSAVVDSYLAGCHMKNQDAHAIAAWAGPGPYKIENNFLEGSGENILLGGGDPWIDGVVPSDIEIRRNHVTKPLSWKTSGAWTVKNLLESKNSQRVLVEGNIFENNWLDGQSGVAIVLKSENQSGGCTWCITADYTFRYNKIVNAPGGFVIASSQVTSNGGPSLRATRVLIANNLFDEVAMVSQPGVHRLFQLGAGLTNVEISHNSGFPDGYLLMLAGNEGSSTSFALRDNLFTRGQLGIYGDGMVEGLSTLAHYAPAAVVTGNVLIGADAAKYPAGNSFPATTALAQLLSYGLHAFQLGSESYGNLTSDGLPAGADLQQLEARLAGVRQAAGS
jgi:plastocyanin